MEEILNDLNVASLFDPLHQEMKELEPLFVFQNPNVLLRDNNFYNKFVFESQKKAFIFLNMNQDSNTESRQPKIVRNRKEAWDFISSWDDDLFYRQFRLPREEVLIIIEKCKSIYPGKSANGYENYRMAQIKGMNSTPGSGPITMELKVAITLRLLAGASYLDMI